MTAFGLNHPGMGEKSGVDRALSQSLFHVRPCLLESTRGGERPCQRIVCKNICARLKFPLRKLDGEFRLLPSGRQEQRQRPRIVLCTIALQGLFDFRGFVIASCGAERVCQSPLKLRQRIDGHGTLQGSDRLGSLSSRSRNRLFSNKAAG